LHPITDITIAAAALIGHFALIIIVFIALQFVRIEGHQAQVITIICAVMFVAIAALLFTNAFNSLWQPLLPGVHVSLPLRTALLITFCADIVEALLLVLATGDAISSPFTPFYFVIPVLAIFLRESRNRVIVSGVAITLSYTFTLVLHTPAEYERVPSRAAHWFVAIATFVLATFIGLVTS
jgi:hypothetical protein